MDRDSKLIFEAYKPTKKVEMLGFYRDVDEYEQGSDEFVLKIENNLYRVEQFFTDNFTNLMGIYYFHNPGIKKDQEGKIKVTKPGEHFFEFMNSRNIFKKWVQQSGKELESLKKSSGNYPKLTKEGISMDEDMYLINKFLVDFDERKRRLYLYNLKPKTEKHFGDVLSEL